jgi:hypothetical protein
MDNLNSEIAKYLKMWGIELDQTEYITWDDSFKRTEHPYIVEN